MEYSIENELAYVPRIQAILKSANGTQCSKTRELKELIEHQLAALSEAVSPRMREILLMNAWGFAVQLETRVKAKVEFETE